MNFAYFTGANGTIITDGEGLLDIRLGQENNLDSEKHPCQGLFETCCTLRSEKPIIPANTKVNVGCGIRNEDGVGFRITGDKDNEAQFGLFMSFHFISLMLWKFQPFYRH